MRTKFFTAFLCAIALVFSCSELFAQTTYNLADGERIVWSKTFDSLLSVKHIYKLRNGSVIALGMGGAKSSASYVYNIGSGGSIVWSHKSTSPGAVWLDGVFQSEDGSLNLWGMRTKSTFSVSGDLLTVTMNSDGSFQKESIGDKVYGEITQYSPDTKLYFDAGYRVYDMFKEANGISARSFGKDGKRLWENNIPDTIFKDIPHISSIAPTFDGGCVLYCTPLANLRGHTMKGIILYKMDSVGKVVWKKSYDTNSTGFSGLIKEMSDKSLLFCGLISPKTSKDTNSAFLMKADSQGNIMWKREYKIQRYNELFAFDKTSDGGLVLVGSSDDNDTNNTSIKFVSRNHWLVKTDSEGKVQYQYTWQTGTTDYLVSVVEADDGNFIVGGTKGSPTPDSTGYYSYVAKVQRVVTSVNESNVGSNMLAVSPLPASEDVELRFSLPAAESVRYSVVNMLGVEVVSERVQECLSGENRISIGIKALPSGAYFVRVWAGGKMLTKSVQVRK